MKVTGLAEGSTCRTVSVVDFSQLYVSINALWLPLITGSAVMLWEVLCCCKGGSPLVPDSVKLSSLDSVRLVFEDL